MKVTFNSIEKIYNLLTTEEWIDKKDSKKRLEQLNKKLAKASDPKEKINLEKAITNLEENAKSNPMTLKKAGINQDDAEILLANIHLLYKEGFNKKSSDTLKELLENNFDQLNTNDVFEKIHKQYLSTNTRLKKILLVKNYVRKYCHIVK
ncbi:MAG: hypothetical protein AB8U88_02830 [Rickettsia conorii subsp. raoultii]|uniref:Acyl-[acyl-carrier-protein]--UDP-N-acetylglucosamine O-acyltransferase n=1 Tax=Rickettsia conorii subsp. raoultii TaxID=369822 RepID=A0ABY4U164_RICCR|nr:hypothetical protein [Rickettsia conorii]URW78377.1 hypothetical protein NBT09_03450 [Rickettsia conorii subsp. raoultii]